MGVFGTKPEPPPPAPLFRTPWRTIQWKENERLLQFIENYKPRTEGQQLRILLHGPVGAGKSSFINSVQSALLGRMYVHALAQKSSKTSFTKTYTTYKIQQQGIDYPFVLNDIMGHEKNGVLVDDIKLALKGHLKDGYNFNPETKISEDGHFYNRNPTPNDIVHVLFCVVPGNSAECLNEDALRKIKDIRGEASKLGIPQVAIVTKIDLASPTMTENLCNVYKDRYLKNMMENFSDESGIPMNCIFPVKNYDKEIDTNDVTDALILTALKNIINFGDDFINAKNGAVLRSR